jgi:hypothetical protein
MPPAPSAMDGPEWKGNPLWGPPVESLHSTTRKPVFSLARPPPTPPRAGPSPEPPKLLHRLSRTRLRLNLVGTIFGSGEGYAGFLHTASHGIVRLKTSFALGDRSRSSA